MTFISTANPWAFVFGLLGNIASFGVYLAPLPTFTRVIRKKSTEEFQSFPYIVALFSAMLWIYYAWVKQNASLLITVNSVGCVIELIYISIFITYAHKKARSLTVKMVAFINFGVLGAILGLTQFLTKGENRIRTLGWICVALSASVFGAPLSVMKLVIRTKSVEFMPFWLSFSLLLSALSWLFYGIFLKDMYIAAPNTLGFALGVAQMILYAIYRKNKGPAKQVDDGDMKLPETVNDDSVKAAFVKPSDSPPAVPVQTQSQPETTQNEEPTTTNPPPAEPQTVVHVGGCGTERAIPDRAVQLTQCAV